jgi:hypothetical protein
MARSAVKKDAHVWDRGEHDWYVEPTVATAALLTVERFPGLILDPCCGGGNIVKTCLQHGYKAIGTDIVRRTDEPWFHGERPFEDLPDHAIPNIISNPPFYGAKGTEAFIRRGVKAATAKLAVFVDIRFLGGNGRTTGLYAEMPPNRVWIITPRVSCPPGTYLAAGNKAGNGSSDWAWMVWDLTSPPPRASELRWLDRSKL